MATSFGYDVFSNSLVNQQFKKILGDWSKFLVTEESRYVLMQNDPDNEAIAWLSPKTQSEMVDVARSALGQGDNPISSDATFSDIFDCSPVDGIVKKAYVVNYGSQISKAYREISC